ncbi:DUF6011 domain-containing protein [Nocardioides scoriae]|uniref:DUF6011 domain-containing protein n=1 Tax=Nocardioides scoriae TaxID=642780 RepID=UPI0038B23921
MTLPERHERRPLAETAPEVIHDDNMAIVATATEDPVRCRRCGHALTAERSVELEVGPHCRHLLGLERVVA